MRLLAISLSAFVFVTVGCTIGGTTEDDDETNGSSGSGASAPVDTSIAVLGDGTHDVAKITLVEIGRQADGLNVPTDLAFNPSVPTDLYVVNMADSTSVVYRNVGQANQAAEHLDGGLAGAHFLAKPAGIAFGAPDIFATAHNEDQPTQGEATPPDFMGPTMWQASLFDAGEFGHIDMLHNSPLGVGIAWEQGNAYWVNDGYHHSITRYDFVTPHEPGGNDHTDGIITRWVEGQVSRVPGVVSHLEFLPGTSQLFIADTGNSRIGLLNTAGATPTGQLPFSENYDSCVMNRFDAATVTTLVDGKVDNLMPAPAGIAIDNVLVGGEPRDVIFVTDNTTSKILAFSLDGELLDWVALGLPAGSLNGITVDDSGNLWLVDSLTHRILRVEPLAQ